ncbi:MAG: hypothetical protein U0797_25100 [Gemmataceae bacterium]
MLAATLLLLAGVDPPKLPLTVDLGGPRKAAVAVAADGDDYVLRARLLAVACFDAATNDRVNARHARLVALGALAQALSGKRSAELAVSGARVEETKPDGRFYTLRLRVPRAGVAVVAGGDRPPTRAKAERVEWNGALLTRKSDHEQTLARLAELLQADIDHLVARRKEGDAEAFDLGVADLEQRGVKNLGRFAAEVAADPLLLFTERDDLADAVAKRKKAFLAALKHAAGEGEGR